MDHAIRLSELRNLPRQIVSLQVIHPRYGGADLHTRPLSLVGTIDCGGGAETVLRHRGSQPCLCHSVLSVLLYPTCAVVPSPRRSVSFLLTYSTQSTALSRQPVILQLQPHRGPVVQDAVHAATVWEIHIEKVRGRQPSCGPDQRFQRVRQASRQGMLRLRLSYPQPVNLAIQAISDP